jgi:hypothetical protein
MKKPASSPAPASSATPAPARRRGSRSAKTPDTAQRQPVASTSSKRETEQLQKLAQGSAGMENALNVVKEEQRLLDERLALTKRSAEDLMS